MDSVYQPETIATTSSTVATPPLPSQSDKFAGTTRRTLTQKDRDDCMQVLKQVFGHQGYKGKQKEIVEAAYAGADVLVVAPTGMGKSICFQIPAVADKRGVSLVVSPLLALMQNQIENLRLKDVEVASLSSQISHSNQQEVSRQLQLYDSPIKLLYVTPERLCSTEFMGLLNVIHENHNLNRLIVDEAHCISEWGHDFREEYRRLGTFRSRYPEVPIMALTATATAAVQQDIIRSLKLDRGHLFTALHPFNRENLFYEIRYLSNPEPLTQMADIFDYITGLYTRRGQASSGIIYCRMRKTCDEMAAYLRGKGINAKPYHRGIPPATLDRTMKGWTNGEGVDLVVATIAFGLGIDKGDVRYILHYDMPKSFEGYYQETGRAGRDGNPAKCILYYSREDAIRVKRFIRSSKPNRVREEEDDEGPSPTQRASGSLEALVKFAESITTCRHVSICRYFGEEIDQTDKEMIKAYCDRMCDVCRNPDKTRARFYKLTPKETASANVPFSNSNFVNATAPPGRQGPSLPHNQEKTNSTSVSREAFGIKRPNTEISENTAIKKPKYAPILVTKPFGSASGLSKPFRPPSFLHTSSPTAAKLLPVNPPPPPMTTKPRSDVSKSDERNFLSKRAPKPPVLQMRDLEPVSVEDQEEELSPIVDLPDVKVVWEPEHSGKAPLSDRQNALDALRRSLHSVLITGFNAYDIWSKISIDHDETNERQRNEIIYKTATELEIAGISFSSTLEGYNSRITAIRGEIRKLRDLSQWGSNGEDFDDVVECLRRCSVRCMKKGKGRMR